LEDLTLTPQLVDLISELLIVCISRVVSLIALVQAKFQILDFLEQLLMLFLRSFAVHELALLQDLCLDSFDFFIQIIL